MAGIFAIIRNLDNFVEAHQPEYVIHMSGMRPDALLSRYIDLTDQCIEMELDMSCANPTHEAETNLIAVMAKMHAVASIAFLPQLFSPFFPWKAPVR